MLMPYLSSNRLKLSVIIITLTVTVYPTVSIAEPQPLSEADRIALEEQLGKIQQQSKDRVGGLFRRAIQDYRSAIKSDDATMELYLKCIEKVRFTDEKRKASEFRDWKRKKLRSLRR